MTKFRILKMDKADGSTFFRIQNYKFLIWWNTYRFDSGLNCEPIAGSLLEAEYLLQNLISDTHKKRVRRSKPIVTIIKEVTL